MSPLQIEILLWYHARTTDYLDGDWSAPAVRDAVHHLAEDVGLLEANICAPADDNRTYRTTPRAEVYIAALKALPLPQCQWVMP